MFLHHKKPSNFKQFSRYGSYMRKDTYENKLSDLLASNKFSESKGTSDWIAMKIEKDTTKEMLSMRTENTK